MKSIIKIALSLAVLPVFVSCATQEYQAEEAVCQEQAFNRYPPQPYTKSIPILKSVDRPTGKQICKSRPEGNGYVTECVQETRSELVNDVLIRTVDANQDDRDKFIKQCSANACMAKYGNASCEKPVAAAPVPAPVPVRSAERTPSVPAAPVSNPGPAADAKAEFYKANPNPFPNYSAADRKTVIDEYFSRKAILPKKLTESMTVRALDLYPNLGLLKYTLDLPVLSSENVAANKMAQDRSGMMKFICSDSLHKTMLLNNSDVGVDVFDKQGKLYFALRANKTDCAQAKL